MGNWLAVWVVPILTHAWSLTLMHAKTLHTSAKTCPNEKKAARACMHACMHACTHAPMHACIHARTHADLGQKCWGGPLIGYLVGCLYLKVGVRFGICASESNGLNHIKFLANKTAGFEDCNLPTAGFEDCKLPTGPSLQP